jgi:hypothetical protein
MKVTMFQKRFAEKIFDGTKCTTIRATNHFTVGEIRSFRYWSAAPYRSKQVEFCKARILEVKNCHITETCAFAYPAYGPCYGHMHDQDYSCVCCRQKVAHEDGFADWGELTDWFKTTHGLPFSGFQVLFEVMPG